jgi:hypothetical protein
MPQVDYTQVIADYEAAIAQTPDDRQLYWHYGLALLLDQQAEAAQTTWWMVLADAGEDEVAWCAELGAVLQQAAIAQTQTGNLPAAALIRQSYQAIVPDDCENLLHLLWLAMQLHTLDLEALEAIGIIPALHDHAITAPALEADLLLAVVDAYLADPVLHPITIELVEAIAHHLKDPTNLVEILLHHSHQIAHVKGYPQLSADLIEVNRRLQPQHLNPSSPKPISRLRISNSRSPSKRPNRLIKSRIIRSSKSRQVGHVYKPHYPVDAKIRNCWN